MPPVPMGLHDGAAVFGHKLPGGGALVNVPGYLHLVKDKVVGIDLSTLLHGLCQSKDIQQMQAVDPRNSVVYPVANLLSTYFKAKALDQARSIIAVCDPKRLNCHHCGQCQETYEAAYATKCDITGRNSRGSRAAASRPWPPRRRTRRRSPPTMKLPMARTTRTARAIRRGRTRIR